MAIDYSLKAPGVYVEQVPSGPAPISGAGTSTAAFIGVFSQSTTTASSTGSTTTSVPAAVGQVVLCTNFTDFVSSFAVTTTVTTNAIPAVPATLTTPAIPAVPATTTTTTTPFSSDHDQLMLAHAVRGFFINGGTRCYVTRVNHGTPAVLANPTAVPPVVGVPAVPPDFVTALQLFESIDEIATVAAPGHTSAAWYSAVSDHVNLNTTGRFALFDTAQTVADYTNTLSFSPLNSEASALPNTQPDSSFGLYFPWLQVYDPGSNASIYVPPSGHIAGLYARVDGARGVFKAPANEVVLGATGLQYNISPRQQDQLNPQGVNCIRTLNGNILVWGARTLGGAANASFRYVNVRRTFNYIRTSLDQGTQFAVFEPNNSTLWATITREATAFLTSLWNSGGLVGDKPAQAFYVKCDAETNPPSVQAAGMVVTEIGVAITQPAEFVVFRLGQLTAQ